MFYLGTMLRVWSATAKSGKNHNIFIICGTLSALETPICNKWHVGMVKHVLGDCWHRANNLQIYVSRPMIAKAMFGRPNAPLWIWLFQSQKFPTTHTARFLPEILVIKTIIIFYRKKSWFLFCHNSGPRLRSCNYFSCLGQHIKGRILNNSKIF